MATKPPRRKDLYRHTVTKSSRSQLPAYPVLAALFAQGYLLWPRAKFDSPAFDVVESIMPLRAWGVVFALLALAQVVAMVTHSRNGTVVVLCLGMGAWAGWACAFLPLALDPYSLASPNSAWAFGFFAWSHFSSLRSITYDRVVT